MTFVKRLYFALGTFQRSTPPPYSRALNIRPARVIKPTQARIQVPKSSG